MFYEKILDKLNSAVEVLISFLLTFMVVVVFLQVVFRFIIHSSLPWSEEAARYLLIWISFLGATVGVKRGAHVGVEAVVNLFGGRKRRAISVVAYVLEAAFFVFLVLYGYRILSIVFCQSSPAMEISMAVPYSSLPVSSAIMLLYTIDGLFRTIFDPTEVIA
ncbi:MULTISPECIES: TRAP transporter small permease [Dethiosulfovibrio]|uniref:TRAP transporter small permease n=2 Tax=Dethiosulfovibrio TaxID=47054 RepID=A0ABS9EQR3_9BACT|nr:MULTISPECIES: TRAP transporter small permease [Dethiosulfovibrio]MCF4113171.1 TRAP transporter small permease [Dethiosulfovibrio russensis]MCF4142235.1 TRAP transporter small permease [Dethiosulfovibrio marinus]MCF4144543.1 TRAP transporter small permease [Dethiosulfovibrio acidaminovorans]